MRARRRLWGAIALGLIACDGSVIESPPGETSSATTSATTASGASASSTSSGGVVDGIIAEGLMSPAAFVLSAEHVYISEQGDGRPGTGSIVRVAKDGGALERVVRMQWAPYELAIAGEYLYWSTYGRGTLPALQRVALAGGEVEALLTTPMFPGEIAIDGEAVVFVDDAAAIRSVAPRGAVVTLTDDPDYSFANLLAQRGTLYFTRQGLVMPEHALRRRSPDGEQRTLYAPNEESLGAVAIDETDLFFATWKGNLYRGTTDGAAAVLLASDRGALDSMVTSGNDVLVASSSEGYVGRVPKAGGAFETLASGQAEPISVGADAEAFYWLNAADGTMRRMAR